MSATAERKTIDREAITERWARMRGKPANAWAAGAVAGTIGKIEWSGPVAMPDAAAERARLADELYAAGCAITPLRGKRPYLDGWQSAPFPSIEETRETARAGNFGVRTGSISGVAVVDLDDACPPQVAAALMKVRTPTVRTGGGGHHLYFECPAGGVGNRVAMIVGVDQRGDGGQVVAPGSIHPDTGALYEWTDGRSVADVPLAPWPADLLGQLAEQFPKPAASAPEMPAAAPTSARHVGGVTPRAQAALRGELAGLAAAVNGTRNATLNNSALKLGHLVGAGEIPESDVRAALLDGASRWFGDDFSEVEARKTIESGLSAGRREPPATPLRQREAKATPAANHTAGKVASSGGVDDKRFTEVGLSDRLIERHGEEFRFDALGGSYRVWSGSAFDGDGAGRMVELAKESARSIYVEAAECGRQGNDDLAAALFKIAKKAETNATITAVLKLARSRPPIPVVGRWDANPMLFNVQNCAVDLSTGKGRPHDRCDLITMTAPVAFDSSARCPRWDDFIAWATCGDVELAGYLARIVGLCLTGRIDVQEFYIFHGAGQNGKNVFADTITGMMGPYAGSAPPSLLTVRPGHQEHPTELADLRGKRLVVGSETEEHERLRIQLIKRITGDARLKARLMRQDYFEFNRTNKTILITNNKPTVSEATHAVWRRLRLVPWLANVEAGQADDRLTEKLRAEWPGILNWAIAGGLDWQRGGMRPPDVVLHATADYAAESDPLAEYFSDRLVEASAARLSRADLVADYASWVAQTREPHPLDRRALFERIRRRKGVTDLEWKGVEGKAVRGFQGVGLLYVEGGK